jgi:hypothetical protein
MEAAGWLWLKKANFLPAGTGFYILWHRLDAKNFVKIFRFPVTSNL